MAAVKRRVAALAPRHSFPRANDTTSSRADIIPMEVEHRRFGDTLITPDRRLFSSEKYVLKETLIRISFLP